LQHEETTSLETLEFIISNWPQIIDRGIEHLSLITVAISIAIVTGVPIGVLITQNRTAADRVLYAAAVIMTIPSIALFGLLIPILSIIGQGIGYLPAVVALVLYSQLPIIRNTYTAIMNIDPALREAARGMGMTPFQRLKEVELPIALQDIINGVRNATVLNIAVATIATYIGAGGLGTFISRGISQTDIRQLLTGALAVSVLAILADLSLLWLQRRLTSPGLRGR
jgi:osmoprotectant transport system permease protein